MFYNEVPDQAHATQMVALLESTHTWSIPEHIISDTTALCSFLLLADQYQVVRAIRTAINTLQHKIPNVPYTVIPKQEQQANQIQPAMPVSSQSEQQQQTQTSQPQQSHPLTFAAETCMIVIQQLGNYNLNDDIVAFVQHVRHTCLMLTRELSIQRNYPSLPSSMAFRNSSNSGSLLTSLISTCANLLTPVDRFIICDHTKYPAQKAHGVLNLLNSVFKLDVLTLVAIMSHPHFRGLNEDSVCVFVYNYVVNVPVTDSEFGLLLDCVKWYSMTSTFINHLINELDQEYIVNNLRINSSIKRIAQVSLYVLSLPTWRLKHRTTHLTRQLNKLISSPDPDNHTIQSIKLQLQYFSPRAPLTTYSIKQLETHIFPIAIPEKDLHLSDTNLNDTIWNRNIPLGRAGWGFSVFVGRMRGSGNSSTSTSIIPSSRQISVDIGIRLISLMKSLNTASSLSTSVLGPWITKIIMPFKAQVWDWKSQTFNNFNWVCTDLPDSIFTLFERKKTNLTSPGSSQPLLWSEFGESSYLNSQRELRIRVQFDLNAYMEAQPCHNL